MRFDDGEVLLGLITGLLVPLMLSEDLAAAEAGYLSYPFSSCSSQYVIPISRSESA